jgi:hypothetical protein
MPLAGGTKLGPYEVTGALGAGGMGEVYRARDTKLGRDVALKVLPPALAADPERIARFSREAKVLASLNHPNIAAIYGFEDSAGVPALVMELIEGPTLASRIAPGAMPLDEALPIARQLAEGLEYAHERGIVHRDLKPANVIVTPQGTAKILDFGLAKALAGETSAVDPATSPTLTHLATQAGIILGTAAYMAPEQAKGKLVDRRADIWAFGCVLYEMLAGRKAFDGDSVTEILAAVVKDQPDWRALPSATPPAIAALLIRCLQKDPRQRLRDIGDARIALDEALSPAAPATALPAVDAPRPAAARRPWRSALPWAIAAAAVLAAALWAEHAQAPRLAGPLMRFTLAPPVGRGIVTRLGAGAVLSPDGRRMAYVRWDGHVSYLWVRALDQPHGVQLPGTEGAGDPFFSYDGQWLGFFAGGQLKTIAISGGAPVTVCSAPDARGAAWGANGAILFTPTPYSPLESVPAAGGTPRPITRLGAPPEPGSRSHRWPDLLPDGKHALFNVVSRAGDPLHHSAIAVVSLATGRYRVLIKGGSYPRFLAPGYIVYVVGADLLAVRFDPSSLRVAGPPVTVLRDVMTELYSGGAQFSFSNNGALLYIPAANRPPARQARLAWVARDGAVQPLTGASHPYAFPRLLPGGKAVVVNRFGRHAGIWLYDIERGTLSPLQLGTRPFGPILTPDGNSVIYDTLRKGYEGLVRRRVDGSGQEVSLSAGSQFQIPDTVSPGGQVVFSNITATGSTLMTTPLAGGRAPQPLLPGPGRRAAAAFSPDGRWIAYVSDESGQSQVYVQASSGRGPRWQISADGGAEPLWAHSGRELFYRAGDAMMAAAVRTTPAFSAAKPVELFAGDFLHWDAAPQVARSTAAPPDYTVSPRDRRFLMVQPVGPPPAPALPPDPHLILNWTALLRGR